MTEEADSPEEIALRLRHLQHAVGSETASAFAARVGLTQRQYDNFVHARGRPGLDAGLKICRTTGVTLDWLYRGKTSGLPLHIFNLLQDTKASEGNPE